MNSFGKAWKSGITSEMGTLSDWYLTISLSSGSKMLLDSHIITQSEFEYLVSIAHSRFLFMYGTAHGLSYLLDPRLLGEGLPPDSRRKLETALFETPIKICVLHVDSLLCLVTGWGHIIDGCLKQGGL